MKYKEGDLVVVKESSRNSHIKAGEMGVVVGRSASDSSRVAVDFNGRLWTNMKEEQLNTPTKLQKLLKEEP